MTAISPERGQSRATTEPELIPEASSQDRVEDLLGRETVESDGSNKRAHEAEDGSVDTQGKRQRKAVQVGPSDRELRRKR